MSIQSTDDFSTQSGVLLSFDPNRPHNDLPDLPPGTNVETPAVLKSTVEARSNLAELKGALTTLENPSLLLNSVVLRESQESSAIENIVTTQDELYRAYSLETSKAQPSREAKEVLRYREAMWSGLEAMQKAGGLSTNVLISIYQKLLGVSSGVRKTPGTRLANPATEKVVYTPPEGAELILSKLGKLEKFIHDESIGLDPLVLAALMHYQFEAIHPFTDGNGRTGRIAIILYMVHRGLFPEPVLFLSKYFLTNRAEYYRCLQDVTRSGEWEKWILYFLKAVSVTSHSSLETILAIAELRTRVQGEVSQILGPAYSAQITSLLHKYPYTKIGTLTEQGIAKRETASKYLSRLVEAGVIKDEKRGRDRYFINHRLVDILSRD